MKRLLCFFIGLLSSFLAVSAFPMGGKIPNVPMKAYSAIDFPDGEFLHYGDYHEGEKVTDSYFVTRKEKNNRGGFYYRVYYNIVAVSSRRKLPQNYTNWPASFLIDPIQGSLIESTGNFDTNFLKDYESFGVGGLISWHYQLYEDQGLVRYTSKFIRNDETITKNYKISVKPGFPSMDMFSVRLIAGRLLDADSPGIFFLVVPGFMKEPISASLSHEKGETTLSTKAGKFRVKRVHLVMGDPFIGKLTDSFMKNMIVLIEDSDRRLPIKRQILGSEYIIEGISNVNTR